MQEEENTLMRKVFGFLALALVLCLAAPAGAAPINGSVVVSTLGTTINGSDLLTATLFSPVVFIPQQVFTGLTTGDYVPVPQFTFGSGGLIDTNNINTYNLNFVGLGTFAAATGQILSQNANFLDALFIGTFTPTLSGVLGGFDPSPTSVRISLNKTGPSTSYGGTMASPPEGNVPEPGTYALIGAGLFTLFALRRKRA